VETKYLPPKKPTGSASGAEFFFFLPEAVQEVSEEEVVE
jgi:hypothetical protein